MVIFLFDNALNITLRFSGWRSIVGIWVVIVLYNVKYISLTLRCFSYAFFFKNQIMSATNLIFYLFFRLLIQNPSQRLGATGAGEVNII